MVDTCGQNMWLGQQLRWTVTNMTVVFILLFVFMFEAVGYFVSELVARRLGCIFRRQVRHAEGSGRFLELLPLPHSL